MRTSTFKTASASLKPTNSGCDPRSYIQLPGDQVPSSHLPIGRGFHGFHVTVLQAAQLRAKAWEQCNNVIGAHASTLTHSQERNPQR